LSFKNWKLKILITFTILIIGLLIFISYIKFSTINIIAVGIGFGKISFSNIEYAVIRNNKQIIISKPDKALDNLMKYMRNNNFILVEQMGSINVFEDNLSTKQIIRFHLNKYYAIWIWH
jgi:hypothetical protein